MVLQVIFFIPYHIGSKDVAFPRLNNLGFWLFPAGYILVAKPAFLRPIIFKYFDKPSFYYKLLSKDSSNNVDTLLDSVNNNFSFKSSKKKQKFVLVGDSNKDLYENNLYSYLPLNFLKNSINNLNSYSYWNYANNVMSVKKKETYHS